MQRWHWTVIGLTAWLLGGGLGLRWVANPYRWTLLADSCDCKNVEQLGQDFSVHLASFPAATTSPIPTEEREGLDPALTDWAWRESIARFGIVFTAWMIAGWFLHWCVSRLARGGGAR